VDSTDLPHRLSQIATRWSLVFEAHQDRQDSAARARAALVHRYRGAVYRYLLGAVRNPDVADDLSQDFALRLVRGDFKRADPGRGRFRDFLKTALYHLIIDYQRRPAPLQLAEGAPEPVTLPEESASDQEFLARWREELFNRAWEGLEEVERATGQPCYTVLRFRSEHPEVRAPAMAEQLGPRLGKAFTDVAIRKVLQRARERFGDLLLAEVARSLQSDDPGAIEQELIDLDLLTYCREALERFARGSEPAKG
jgi:RNA polymerase sigma-70 factor (ECF subfamily)